MKGGLIGGVLGLAGGTAGVLLAARRYHTIRSLTLPMKAFLVTSSATFVGIVAADHASRDFENQQNQERQWFENREERLREEELRGLSFTDRTTAFARREKYKIIGVTWLASIVGSFALVGRNPYLSGQQKLVQARVYAQGLTLAVLCASAAFEISDQRRGRGILDAAKQGKGKMAKKEAIEMQPSHSGSSPSQSDLWKDMVAAEEQRLKEAHQPLYKKQHDEETPESHEKNHPTGPTSEDSKSKGHLPLEGDLKNQKVQAERESKKKDA